jgi:diamine N-acetyltransferase
MNRVYPDDPAGPFERPPIAFEDAEGRSIRIEAYEPSAEGDDAPAFEAAFSMYVGFDPADRAQGIPPTREAQIEEWLTTILADGFDVLACHGEECVGHATLVPDGGDSYELAIFVSSVYQHAGIGSELIDGLLGYGQESGAETVWLTVERWNDTAIALYRKVGFETSNAESFEHEMSIRL